ncbi:28S ribosomal protein S2, mitochondrial [Octopus sinensis]|uniref:Small ribosomal subunit protein uS2m n=1 Tax=Octopus sinensis TaxID=2607531 RepID=A0A6P7TIN4_9MOLL|nr:28S ribosomal protein S2, mitochondrial [Octopus sinensis]
MSSLFTKVLCPKQAFHYISATLTQNCCRVNNVNPLSKKSPFPTRFSSSVSQTNPIHEEQRSVVKSDEAGGYIELAVPKEEDYFGVHKLVTIKKLFSSRVHFGHKKGLRNPYMLPYIYGNRLDVDIIDLDKTLPLFQNALNFTAHIAYQQGIILFMSRHIQMMPIIEQTARECGEYANCREWGGGIFTNSKVMFGAVTRLPDLVIFISTLSTVFEPHTAIRDSAKMCIPTIGIVDTNTDPRLITYPVPGNDDSPASIELYLDLFKSAILIGKEKRKQDESKLV